MVEGLVLSNDSETDGIGSCKLLIGPTIGGKVEEQKHEKYKYRKV